MEQALSHPTLLKALKAIPGLELREHEPMAKHLSMGVGGLANLFATVPDEPALLAVLAVLREQSAPWMVLGGGSNTIFTDAGYDGVVLSLGRGFKALTAGPGEHEITAGAAAPLSAVMNFAKRCGLTGLEWAAGIPGALGGALVGNAGTHAGEICHSVESVEVIDAAGVRQTRKRGTFSYGYRHSDLRADIILGATLALEPAAAEEIKARIDAALSKRWEQPVGVRCSGCMFKNPEGDFAGRLIDLVGLKGMRVGGARVSEEHANFIINDGSATAGDICNLLEIIRWRVFNQYGIELKLEIRMVGLDSQP